MTNHQDVCSRWADRAAGKTDRKLLRGSRIFGDDNTLYSYGYHFVLAHALKDKKGQTALFLLNGDRYSVSTTQHQGHVRQAVARTDVPSVIIPFSALVAAGIDVKSVEAINVSSDRTETKRHERRQQPEGSVWRTLDVHANVALTEEELDAKVEQYKRTYGQTYTRDRLPAYDLSRWQVTGQRQALYTSSQSNLEIEVTTDEEGTLYSWETSRHWLGEALIRAKVITTKRVNCKVCKGSGRAPAGWFHEDHRKSWGEQFHCDICGGRGGRAVYVTRTAFFLSGFDHNERRPSYFFCELPKTARPTSVEEAYEALKPQAVKTAEQASLTVYRQGDIFAIDLFTDTPARMDKKTLRALGATEFVKSGTLLGTNHIATEVTTTTSGTTFARGILKHDPAGRRPDHARVILGDRKQWHLIVKNTVPTTKG
jgi:hypothetical protein